MRKLVCSAAVCATAGMAHAATVPTVADVSYGPYEPAERQTLDFYVPDGVDAPPIVMWIHGGAWYAGDKSSPTGVQEFLDAGIAVASMNYRLTTYDGPPSADTANGTTWPGQLEDITKAFAFVRDSGATYGYDGSRVASFGASAGAHLSAWAGLALADDPDTRLAATVTWYPPADLIEMDADDDASSPDLDFIEHLACDSPESLLVGACLGETDGMGDLVNRGLADAASPAVFASFLPEDTVLPAFLIMHGDGDPLVSYLQSVRLFDAIDAQGGSPDLQLRIVEGLGHGGPGWEEQVPYVVDFMDAAFAVQPAPVPVPAALPMMLAGLGMLTAFGCRRKASTPRLT